MRFVRRLPYLCVLAWIAVSGVRAAQTTVTIGGTRLAVTDVSSEVALQFRAMRLNRAQNVWNFEASMTNRGIRDIRGPFVVVIQSFSGTSGPLQTDGVDESVPARPFYSFSELVPDFTLSPGEQSGARTLTLGVSAGTPQMVASVFAAADQNAVALGFIRTLDAAGQPLPLVQIEQTGVETNVFQSDSVFGVASIGTAGLNHWEFSAPGFLPVWRSEFLTPGVVTLIPSARLTALGTNRANITVVQGGQISASGIRVQVPPGAMAQNGELTLTRLDGQTLPLRLPFGWSPLQSFWILSEENFTASASLAPSDNILGSDTLAFVKLRESDPAWIVTELLSGAGTNAVTAQLNGSGAYALVVADRSPTAPPSPQGGKALLPTSFSFSSSSPLKAGGKVTPSVATASRSPEAITAQAEVIITNLSGGMPSGLMFHAELLEEYRLSDGGTRTPPRYENFLTTYQRPGDGNSAKLHSFFSLRPLFLFGPEELEIATLNVDVMASADFAGAVLNSTGGAVASGRVRIRAGVGDIFGQQAIQLRAINPTNFASIAGSHAPEAAFELAISGVASGRRLSVQLDAATPNSSYVLGRVLYDAGQYGIQPIERIATDAAGAFRSTEPITGDRLDAITGAGQYVILKTASPQNLIIGQTRNSSGQLASAMPVRITGQPWLTFSGTNGSYKLIAPSGNISVSTSDPVTGDAGESAVVLNQPVTTVNLAVGAHGPRAILLSPTVTTNVSRVAGIQIGFNEPINPGTLDTNGVELIEANGQVVPATVVLNLRNTVVTILPSDPLSAGTTFFLRLSTNITDSAGLRIEGETEFTFETQRSVARADFAKLTIFEPGATNIPANIRSQLVGFDPIVHSESVVAAGSPGTAEGEVPVILVNDNTGETSTVLSKPDGSFFGFIEAVEDEFISAVFVNANGTRTTVPASRQNFDDGRVGLYRSGGILEAESDGGPVQVIVQPEAIPTRATFALDVVGLAEVLQAASGVAPDGAAFAAEGLKLRVEGQVEGDVQVKFPVDPAKLPLPPGTDLSEAAFALAAIRKVGGETGYEILDELTFQTEAAPARILAPGMLAKRSPAFLAILGGGVGKAFIVFEQIVIPLVVGTKRFAVNGRTMEGFIDGTGTQIGDPLGNLTGDPTSNFAASLLAQAVLDELDFTGAGVFTHFIELLPGFMARPLPGCFVTLKPARLRQVPDLQPNGRIKPGLVYTTSDRSGRFKLLGFAASEPFVVQAIHPRFEDKPAEPVIALTESQVLSPGDVRKFLFFISPLNSLRGANVFTVSSTPENPQPGQAVTVSIRKRAQTGAGAPSVNVAQDGAPVPLRPGQPVAISDVTISAVSSPTLEADGTLLWTLTVACPHPARISLRVTSEGTGSDPLASANNATLFHTLTFLEQRPPLPPEDVAKADDADRVGPFVQRISPETGGALVLGQPLEIQFNEPISKAILNHAGELIARPLSSGTTVTPVVRLSDDQRTLFLSFAGAVPGATYEVTLGAFLKDLAQNPFDSDPSQSGDQGQPVPFRTITLPAAGILPEVGQGGGSTIVRNHMFVLDRQGSGSLKVFDISNPAEPTEVGRVALPGTPRDLIFIPKYSYVLENENSPVQTNDLLAVIGGALGTQTIDDDGNLFFSGQYLRIYNISNPANPTRVVFAQISLRNTAVTKIEWHPPNLVYLEKGSDLEAVSFINLQEFLFGFTIPPNRVLAPDRIEGVDLTEDGDFVDDGERIPHPPAVPNEFFGKRDTFTIEGTNQKILDFAYDRVTDMLSVVVSDGFPVFAQTGTPDSSAPRRPAAYRTLRAFDRDIRPPGELPFELGAHPKRVFLLRGQVKHLVNGQELLRRLALVSLAPDGDGIPKLAVIDVAIPEQPILLNKIPLPESTGGLPQTVNVRSDGVLEMATSSSVVRLLIERLFEPMPAGSTATDLHPSITAVIPGAGTGAISLDGNDAGVLGTALGGKNQVVFTGPSLEFLRFPTAASLPQPDLLKADPALARSEFAKAQVVSTLVPARFRAAAGVPSTLAPPRPELHYYVRVRAPGGLGTRIRIAIQSLNEAGEPLRNKGKSFPPVQALGADAATSIGQTARADCDAAISELTAIRLSDDRTSDLYNTYLTEPLALTYEKMSIAEVNALRATPKRQIFWSGSFLRAFIDSSHLTDPGLGAFSATIDTERRQLSPGAVVVAATLPAFYILGDNPPPASGDIRLPGTFGTLSAHNGEFRHETIDASLPGRRMPIVFQRATGGQDLYSGPFGRGWDHNYNQRVIFLDKELFAADAQMPLIVRSTLAENTTAKPEDLVLQTGGGRTILFKKQPTVPTTISSDPLVQELQWLGRSDAVFLPDVTEKGVFDLCFKFKDGQYARLTPDGRQFWYAKSGRLERIYHRYTANSHQLIYNPRGELTKIIDNSISGGSRFLRLGYFRPVDDPIFDNTVDRVARTPHQIGKIARLVDYASTSSEDQQTLFNYTADGVLEERLGPKGSPGDTGPGQRARTVYLLTDDCGQSKGIVAGGYEAAQGTPLVVANATGDNPEASQATIAGGATLGIARTGANTAAAVSGTSTSVNGPGTSVSAFTFDAAAFPKSITYSGGIGPSASYTPTYNAQGLLGSMVYPEGSSATYTYDPANAVFRSRGNLKRIELRAGPRASQHPQIFSTYNYDSRYNLLSDAQTDFNGATHRYTLGNNGRDVFTVAHQGGGGTDPAGAEQFDFDETTGQIKKSVSPEGIEMRFEYESGSGFVSKKLLGGIATGFSYDQAQRAGRLGIPTNVDLPVHDDVTAEYDNRLLLIEWRRGSALAESRRYDENGNRVSLKRSLGGGKFYEETAGYSQVNFMEFLTVRGEVNGGAAESLTWDYVPDSVFNVGSIKYPNGETRIFTRDHQGRITKNQIGNYFEDYTRDRHGNITEVKQGGIVTRKFSFDGHDRLTGFTRLRGNIEEQRVYAHFPGGEMASFKVTDPEFGGTIYEKLVSRIDCLGRPKAEKETGSNSDANYSYTYPTAAGTEMVLSGPRDSLRVTYDAAGRVRKRVTTVADQTLTPDNNGNLLGLLSQEDGTPYDATFGYNTLDQLTSIALDGPVVDIAPRLDGLPETLTDGASRTVQQDYTLLGEIASITRQNGVEFRFHYDKNRQSTFVGDKQLAGEATSFTDLRPSTVSLRNPGANLTLAAHNHLNLPEQITLPGNGTIDLDYDLQGRAIRQDVNFDTTLYELDLKHDALGRVRKVDFVTDLGGANSLTLDFDKLGPLTTSKLVVAGFPQFVTSSTLYSDGTRNTVTYPTAGLSITEDRQSSGRLNSISLSPGGEILKIDAYKGAQQPKSGTLAGGAISWVDEYDGRKRTLSRRYVRTAGNLPLADVRYQYDGADNVIARQLVHAHGRADLYAYDNGNRISISSVGARPQVANSAPRGSGGGILNGVDAQGLAAGFYGRTYGYDGNAGLDRLQTITPVNPDALTLPPGLPIQFAQTIETPVSGFLFATVIDGQTRTPDALGSATTSPLFIRPPAASGPVRVAASIRHNGLSHLTSLQYTEPGGPAVSIVYEHLPSGLITRRILTRGSQVVADQAYIWDVGRLIEIHDKSTGTNLLTARFFYADSDAPFAADLLQAGALKRFYLLQDAMSTVMAVADDTGAVVERVHYDVFGQPEIEGKDIAPPRVAAVVALPGNELLVHFSERVLPPLASTAAPAFVTATIPLTGGINGSFEIVDAGGPVSIQTPQYEDVTAGGLPFGSVIRIQTARALVGPAILRVKPGIVTDEWGLPNVEETATLNLATAPGTVFTGLASGATAPPRLARSSVGNPFLFQGQLFDYEAGLINMRARFYDPSSGLFLERDPLGYEDSPNHYAGLAFNPASLRDPTGTATRRRSVPEPSTGTGNVRSKIPKYPTSGPGSKTPQDTGRGAIYLPEHSEPKPPQPTIVVDDSLNPDPPSPSKAAREEVTKAIIYRHGGDSPSAAGPDDISDVFASSGSAPGGFNEKAAANANVGSQIQLLNGTDVGNQKTEIFGLNLFNRALDDKGDPIDQIAHNFDNPAIRDRDSGFYDVGVHGNPNGTIWFKENDGSWTRIDFDTLVALMSAHGYQKGMPIRLSSCHQGNANIKDGIAHKLSAKFDAYLVAPETPLLISRKRGYGPDEGGGWGEFLNGKYLGRFP